jgi:clan AA aspartic protease
MGIVYTEITLKNTADLVRVKDGYIKEKEIRQTTVKAMVDTGAGTIVINESIRQKLGLDIEGLRNASFGNGTKEVCKVTEPVKIIWNERSCNCSALVVPGTDEVLLGAIPLEDMDLMVNPAKLELVGAHGDEIVCMVK